MNFIEILTSKRMQMALFIILLNRSTIRIPEMFESRQRYYNTTRFTRRRAPVRQPDDNENRRLRFAQTYYDNDVIVTAAKSLRTNFV